MSREKARRTAFQFFNEVGILHQLSGARMNRRLPAGLVVSHFAVINHLVRLGDGKSPLALARAFQVTKGAMTNTLSKLEQLGFVRARPHPTDGRSKLIYLTEAGARFREGAIDALEPEIDTIGRHFDLSRLEDLLPVLQELREVMDRYRDG